MKNKEIRKKKEETRERNKKIREIWGCGNEREGCGLCGVKPTQKSENKIRKH